MSFSIKIGNFTGVTHLSGGELTASNVLLDSEVSNTLPVANGGTGETTLSGILSSVSPLTTKGDIFTYSTVNDRLPVGTNGYVLTADSGEALGIKWAAITGTGDFSTNTATSVDSEIVLFSGTSGKLAKRATGTGVAHVTSGVLSASAVLLTSEVSGTLPLANGGTGQTSASAAFGALSPLTTKGDLLTFSTVNDRLPVGTDGQVLTADSGQTLGIKWATAGSGTLTIGQAITGSTPNDVLYVDNTGNLGQTNLIVFDVSNTIVSMGGRLQLKRVVYSDTDIIGADVTIAAFTDITGGALYLPLASTYPAGTVLIIKDEGGNANLAPIGIYTNGSDRFNRASQVAADPSETNGLFIAISGGCLRLYSDGGTHWFDI